VTVPSVATPEAPVANPFAKKRTLDQITPAARPQSEAQNGSKANDNNDSEMKDENNTTVYHDAKSQVNTSALPD